MGLRYCTYQGDFARKQFAGGYRELLRTLLQRRAALR